MDIQILNIAELLLFVFMICICICLLYTSDAADD